MTVWRLHLARQDRDDIAGWILEPRNVGIPPRNSIGVGLHELCFILNERDALGLQRGDRGVDVVHGEVEHCEASRLMRGPFA